MKPYFETENGKLYHGDCLEIMPELEPVALVLTDPPYGLDDWNDRGINSDRAMKYSEVKKWDRSITSKEISLITEKSRHQILWGANHYIELLKNTKQMFIWDKKNRGMHFNDCEIAWCSGFKSACRIYEQHMSTVKKKVHPTQKPVGLMIWCLGFNPSAETVLDCYLGSGTTAIACERLNRKWIGIEISEKYCEIAAKRIEQETRQRKLF